MKLFISLLVSILCFQVKASKNETEESNIMCSKEALADYIYKSDSEFDSGNTDNFIKNAEMAAMCGDAKSQYNIGLFYSKNNNNENNIRASFWLYISYKNKIHLLHLT